MQKVSDLGGDASHIVINLTDMDDEEYKIQVTRANKLVSKFTLRAILNYYGIFNGWREYLRTIFNAIRLKINDRMFETP